MLPLGSLHQGNSFRGPSGPSGPTLEQWRNNLRIYAVYLVVCLVEWETLDEFFAFLGFLEVFKWITRGTWSTLYVYPKHPKTMISWFQPISAYFSQWFSKRQTSRICAIFHKPRHHDGEDTKTARPCKALHQSLRQNHGLRHLENLTILLELSNAIHTGSLCKYHCRNSLSFSGRIFSESRLPKVAKIIGVTWILGDQISQGCAIFRNGQFQIEIGSFCIKAFDCFPTGQIRAKKTSHPSHPRHPKIQSIFGGCCDAIDIYRYLSISIDIYRCYLPTKRAEVFFLLICDIIIICDMETHGKSKYWPDFSYDIFAVINPQWFLPAVSHMLIRILPRINLISDKIWKNPPTQTWEQGAQCDLRDCWVCSL